ncbi:MAG: ribokinase [Pelagibacteraceae bacterium]|nr:ribokinase [Pelagibacteraceae bacterium]|tara:strand:+ start:511 stop:1407 length:897 start_codon:yes stop_codon:yes gene_type:complete
MSDITVLGIFVADISFSGNKIPTTGETILGDNYNVGPGGKGCNQAIAISRLGGKVNFISKLGNDDYGKLAIDKLKKDKIDTSNIIISNKHKTGVAGIHVDRNTGKNAITVVRGAPSSLTIKEINTNLIKKSKIFLTQLEIPTEVTLHCLKAAKEFGLINILNPAPASKLSNDFFNLVDYFTPNEIEAEFYTGVKITDQNDAKVSAKKLIDMGIKKVIITLGEKGLFYSDGKEEIYMKASPDKAVDTTGAGDAFNGAFSFALLKGKKIKDCLEMANKVAGISTKKLGAGDSMPFLNDVI